MKLNSSLKPLSLERRPSNGQGFSVTSVMKAMFYLIGENARLIEPAKCSYDKNVSHGKILSPFISISNVVILAYPLQFPY